MWIKKTTTNKKFIYGYKHASDVSVCVDNEWWAE